MRRLVHVLPRLEQGGAERVLIDVSRQLTDRWDQVVISLADRGALADTIEASGIPVHTIGMHPTIPNPLAFSRLVRLLRRLGPDLVETWLYKADLVGGLATRLAGRPPLLWSVQQTHLEPVGRLRSNVVAAHACARLSRRLPTLILCASEEAARAHEELGYDSDKLRVVPNGVDTTAFRPDSDARTRVRAELGLPASTAIVGLVARFDPQKDHATFARAARAIVEQHAEIHFVLCGRRITPENQELTNLLENAGIRDRVSLLGVRHDMPAITAAFDIATSSSAFGEAFSVAISEAMASGVPCVATDSGNAAALIDDVGRVVPARNPSALAAGVLELLQLPEQERQTLGRRARRRVEANFSIDAVAEQYDATFEEVLRVSHARP